MVAAKTIATKTPKTIQIKSVDDPPLAVNGEPRSFGAVNKIADELRIAVFQAFPVVFKSVATVDGAGVVDDEEDVDTVVAIARSAGFGSRSAEHR